MRDRIKPTLNLYRHRTTGDFTILNFAMDPRFGAPTGWGPLVHFGAHRMEREGAELILSNLAAFYGRSPARSEMEAMSIEEVGRFNDDHKLLVIRMETKSELVVTSMTRVGAASHQGEDERTIRLPIAAVVFYEQILSGYGDR